MKTLFERWKAKMPAFWAKIHKAMLVITGLQGTILATLENQTILAHVPALLISVLKYGLTISVTATLLSKLTIDKPTEQQPNP
jgi:hypothetical protein